MMSKLKIIEEMLPELNRAEKAELLQSVVRDLGDSFPGIDATQGICGGESVDSSEPPLIWDFAIRLAVPAEVA